MNKWTKWQLMSAFINRTQARFECVGGPVMGVIASIQHEDGSGSSFNVEVHTSSDRVTVYVRTID